MPAQALPYISFLGFLFGSTLIVSRFSVGQFHPTTYVGLRLTMASLGHAAVYIVVSRRYRWPTNGRLWLHATILGILGTAVPMTSIVASLQYLSSGIASILITTNPAITILLAHFLLPDESLTRRKALGVTLALAGAVLLTVRGESGLVGVGRADPIGYVLMLMAMLFGSLAAIYIRRFLKGYNSFDVASIRMIVAAIVVMPLSFLFVGLDLARVNNQGYMALIYAALMGTFGGMFLMVYNIKRFGATAAAMTAYIVPVVAGVGGVLFLDEKITAGMLIGVALIVGGLAIINRRPRKLTAATTPPG